MGCQTSSSADASSPPKAGGSDDPELDHDPKKVGGRTKANEDKEDDFFAVEEAQGEQFMSVRPWIG